MTNGKNRTLAFQIDEELFLRIKAHLERESARLGRKVTQRVSAPFENVDFRRNGVSFLTGQHTGVIQP